MKKKSGGYKHVISLGSFCSPALEIERLGLRDGSYPFDWVLSRSMNNVVELISNGFSDLFNVDYFYQWKSQCSTYENIKCDCRITIHVLHIENMKSEISL